MHSTNNLNDSYLGSGKILARSISKYGKNSHVREILELATDKEDLKEKERSLINEDMLNDPLCMNLKIGGEGGFSKEDQLKLSIKGNESLKHKFVNDIEFKENFSKTVSNSCKGITNFLGKIHSDETKRQMSLTHKLNQNQVGKKNSQYGKCWIHNDILRESKSINRDLLDQYLLNGWTKGRKIKF